MRKPQYLAAILNLFTMVGGFFYLRRPYRAVVIGLFCIAGPTIMTILYFEFFESIFPIDAEPRRQYGVVTFFNLVVLAVVSALVALVSAKSTKHDDEIRPWRWAAAGLFSIVGMGTAGTITYTYFAPQPNYEQIEESNARLEEEGGYQRFPITSYSLDGDANLLEGESRVSGRATLDGEPLSNVELRATTDFNARSRWASTDENGRFSFPAGVRNHYFTRVDVRRNGRVDLGGLTLITGLEPPYDDGRLHDFNMKPRNGMLVRAYANSTSDPLEISFLTMLSPAPVDMSDFNAERLRDTTVTWQEVEGAAQYVFQILQVGKSEDAQMLLMQRSIPVNELAMHDLLAESSAPENVHYEILVAAYDEKGQLLNHSPYKSRLRLELPVGWSIKDVYESPCERRAREAAEGE